MAAEQIYRALEAGMKGLGGHHKMDCGEQGVRRSGTTPWLIGAFHAAQSQ